MGRTLNIEDNLLDQASKMTGTKEKTTLVNLGLEALIARESGKRRVRLGGSEEQLKQVPRRRGTIGSRPQTYKNLHIKDTVVRQYRH